MPSIFDTLTFEQVRAYITIGIPSGELLESIRDYIAGDHWQKGKGWIGPRPELRHPDYRSTMDSIETAFVSKNTVTEVQGRHVAGAIGRGVQWQITVSRPLAKDERTGEMEELQEAEEELIAEAESILQHWWNTRDVGSILTDGIASMLYASRGVFRLFIPPGKLYVREVEGDMEGGTLGEEVDGVVLELPSVDDPLDALDLVFLDTPLPDTAAVHLDRDYMEPVGVYLYAEGNEEVVEITYTDDEGNTTLRKITEDGEGTEPVIIPMGGRLWMYQMNRPPLITRQVLQSQALINMTLTMLGRNAVQGAFLERIILNAQQPYHKETDPETGIQKIVHDPYITGPGTTNFLTGVVITDEATGEKKIANPSVIFRDPIDVSTFIETKEAAYHTILEETHQLHAAITGDATASAVSRIQARADFKADLEITATQLEGMVRWLLETLLALAGELLGEPERYAELRATVDVLVDPGPLTPEERGLIIERYQAGLLSRRSAIQLLGTSDADGETAQIEAEASTSLVRMKDEAEIIRILSQAGVYVERAAQRVGWEDAEEVGQADVPPDVTQ